VASNRGGSEGKQAAGGPPLRGQGAAPKAHEHARGPDPYALDAAACVTLPSATQVQGRSLFSPDRKTRTLAIDIDAPSLEEDPFAARATDASLVPQSAEAVALEAAPFDDEVPATRADLAPLEDEEGAGTLSLSDIVALAEDEDDEATDSRRDTLLSASLLSDQAAPPFLAAREPRARTPPQGFALPRAPLVERKSYDPSALFEERSATAPHRAAATRVGALPSFVSQPSDDEDSDDVDAPDGGALATRGGGGSWIPPSVADDEDDDDDATLTAFDELASDGEPPPVVHRWKVVPTAISALDGAQPKAAAPPRGYSDAPPRALQTVIWRADQEAAERKKAGPAAPSRNPFWAPTDAGQQIDDDEEDDDLQSTEAQLPSSPRMAAAAYVSDAVAYLRSLSSFGAHLDDEVRAAFDERLLGCNERLRRALAILHTAEEEADDEP
jgi:hypothetical protein